MKLPEDFVRYLRSGAPSQGELQDFPLSIKIWPEDELEKRNTEYHVAQFAPGFYAFGSDGGGEMYAFGPDEAIYALPFIGMEPKVAKRLTGSWADFASLFHLPLTVDALVSNWLNGDGTAMMDATTPPGAHPEKVWQAVLRIMEHKLSEDQIAVLAAGPVEDLLALYGAQFIDRIEAEAKRSPAFAHVLGGVWRREMPEEIWQRVETARGGKVW